MSRAPVGLVSRARAEYLMRAASVAGGAVYVALPPVEGLTEPLRAGDSGGLLAVGTLPSGEPVPTVRLDADRVWSALVAEERRLDRLGLREWRDEIRGVLCHLAPRIGRDVPTWPEDEPTAEELAEHAYESAYLDALAALGGVTTDRRVMRARRRRARRMARAVVGGAS